MPRKPKSYQPIDPTVSVLCLQCDEQLTPLRKPHLYCSLVCGQEAEIVRYIRKCAADGRLKQDDVQIAIETRTAHIASGGYDKVARRLSKKQRGDVIARSQRFCVLCGKAGLEVDHIDGPSSDPKNLQLLCKECHQQKTSESIRPVSPDSETYVQVKAIVTLPPKNVLHS